MTSDIRRDVDIFYTWENDLAFHQCCESCTHCRVCFDLNYNLLRPNEDNEKERAIRSNLPAIEYSAKSGCPICSLLTDGVKIAFSADRTGKALREIEGANLDICVQNGRTVILRFSSGDFDLIGLEYFTLAGITRTEVIRILANWRLDRSS